MNRLGRFVERCGAVGGMKGARFSAKAGDVSTAAPEGSEARSESPESRERSECDDDRRT